MKTNFLTSIFIRSNLISTLCLYSLFLNILCAYLCSSESHEGKAPSPSITRQSSIETDRVSQDFVEFLKTLQKPGREIHKQSRGFIESMGNKKVRTRVTCPQLLLDVSHLSKHIVFVLIWRISVLKSCLSVCRTFIRACLTDSWIILKVEFMLRRKLGSTELVQKFQMVWIG